MPASQVYWYELDASLVRFVERNHSFFIISCKLSLNRSRLKMTDHSQRQSSWLRYSEISSDYFSSLRVDRSLARVEKLSLGVDCQLHKSHRCRVDGTDLTVLEFRLTTSRSGEASLLAVTVDLAFQQDMTKLESDAPKVTFCQPVAIKGVPQTKHKTGQQSLEPQVSVGDAVQVSLGGISKSVEWDSSTGWMFQCMSQSHCLSQGHYDSFRLQLHARNRQSISSYCQRPLIAAASLVNIEETLIVTSQTKLRTSLWLPLDRIWRPSYGTGRPQRRVIKIGSSMATARSSAFGTFEEFEAVIPQHVQRENEQNLPFRE